MKAPLPIFQICKLAAFTIDHLAMTFFVRHEQHDRATNNISGLVVALPKSSDYFFGNNTSCGPGGRNGIDADGNIRIELSKKGTKKAKDSVLGGRWKLLVPYPRMT
jgi:hypothetical protein